MILVVENDDTTRVVLAHALERRGYHVTAVADGSLVWPTVEAGGVELVIVDLRMPGMNGWEVLRRLRDAHRALTGPRVGPQVIVVSAQSDPETQTFVIRLGAAAFLAKPIDLDDLDRTVREALARGAGS